jgi:hypothetical protein
MDDPARVEARSPDGRHLARVERMEEVRMGSPLFGQLYVDDRELAWRSFGQHLLWSPDSRWIAVQELLDTYDGGPVTQVVAIEAETFREWGGVVASGGFAEPVRFERRSGRFGIVDVLVCRRVYYGDHSRDDERELFLPR